MILTDLTCCYWPMMLTAATWGNYTHCQIQVKYTIFSVHKVQFPATEKFQIFHYQNISRKVAVENLVSFPELAINFLKWQPSECTFVKIILVLTIKQKHSKSLSFVTTFAKYAKRDYYLCHVSSFVWGREGIIWTNYMRKKFRYHFK